ncbi:hypothetical protein FRB90_011257 [Tulasnella sp. 427]|nr:hypothetical protein FRB90_011257 [Tulasnella sp. 427]
MRQFQTFQNLLRHARKDIRDSAPDRDVNGNEDPDIQAALVECTRLDQLTSFRMDSAAFRFVADTPDRAGGKATVRQAVVKYGDRTEDVSVAVKRLNFYTSIDKKKFAKQFVREVDIMAELNHERIVKLIGFVEDIRDGEAWIIMPWEPNGNLADFLASGDWAIPERLSLIQDMFGGVEYLHTRTPPIIHGDLKSMNILVGSDYHAMITDFGSARTIDDRDQNAENEAQGETTPQRASEVPSPEIKIESTGNQLTLTVYGYSLRWAPPEVVNGERANLASDVWSAGWVCWEVMTDKLPFDEQSSAGQITIMAAQGTVPVPGKETQLGQPSTPPEVQTGLESKTMSTALLQQLGNLDQSRGNYDEAKSVYTRALALAGSERDENAEANALDNLGDVYRLQGKYSQAEESYKLAQEIYARIGDELGQAHPLRGLGNVYRLQGKSAQAEESYKLAQEIYTRMADELGRARAVKGLGDVYQVQGKYAQAEESYKFAQEIYTRIGDELGRANALRGLGDVYQVQGKYAQAEESYKFAQEIYTRIGNELGRAKALRGLGDVYQFQGKYAQAEESYKLAQKICSRIGSELDRANALNGLGNVYRSQDKYAQAEESYRLAQEIYSRIGSELGRANALNSLGDVYQLQDKYAQAEESNKLALEIYMRIGSELGRANALKGLGDVYRCQDKYAQAEESYKLAQEVYTRIGDNLGLANTQRGFGHLARSQGTNTEAAEFFRLAMKVFSSIGRSADKDDCAQWLNVVINDLEGSLETS